MISELIDDTIAQCGWRERNTELTANFLYFLCCIWPLRHWTIAKFGEQAVALAPELALAHVSRGDVLAAMGRPDAAAEAYRDALDLEPEPSVREQALRGLESTPSRSAERDEPA